MSSSLNFALILLSLITYAQCSSSSALHRPRRQFLGTCWWGQQAVSTCLGGGYCGRAGYTCDMTAGQGGRCCATANNGFNNGGFINGGINNDINRLCADGSTPISACYTRFCFTGYVCQNNMCCRNTGNTVSRLCADGSLAVGTCPNGLRCTVNQYCNANNFCCRNPNGGNNVINNQRCPDGTLNLGTCPNGNECAVNQICSNNRVCCRNTNGNINNQRCPDQTTPFGTCPNGNECLANQICTNNRVCCRNTNVVNNGCPLLDTPVGPCIDNLCPEDYTCNNGNCCAANRFVLNRQKEQRPVPKRTTVRPHHS